MIQLIISSLRSHAKQMVSAVVILSLSLFLIMQQMSTLHKVIGRTYGVELQGVDVWVMATEAALSKIKNVEGVLAVAPFYKGTSYIKGKKWSVIGIDSSSYLGLPRNLKTGNIHHLALDGAILIDAKQSHLKAGNILPIGKHRAVIVGTYSTSKDPIIYTTIDRAKEMAQLENSDLPFLLVRAKEGVDLSSLCQKIRKATGSPAFSRGDFVKMVTHSYLKTAGMPSHFAWAVFVGFVLALGIISVTLISVCEKLRYNLDLFYVIGAPSYVLRMLGVIHSVGVCLLSFFVSFLFSAFFAFSWKVVGVTLMALLLMGSIIPLLFVRSNDRLQSAL